MRGQHMLNSLRRDLALVPGEEVAGLVIDVPLKVFFEVGFFVERREVTDDDLLSDSSGLLED